MLGLTNIYLSFFCLNLLIRSIKILCSRFWASSSICSCNKDKLSIGAKSLTNKERVKQTKQKDIGKEKKKVCSMTHTLFFNLWSRKFKFWKMSIEQNCNYFFLSKSVFLIFNLKCEKKSYTSDWVREWLKMHKNEWFFFAFLLHEENSFTIFC